ncbi:UNVERIFIED_CONTAM: hypothetical protein FKN15_009452 [Acipenser sinensis]
MLKPFQPQALLQRLVPQTLISANPGQPSPREQSYQALSTSQPHYIGNNKDENRVSVLESCAALKEEGFAESGRYAIDPDRVGQGVFQFEVYCDMTSNLTTGITVASHDSESRMRVAPCEEQGCYGRELKYEAHLIQINALTRVSKSLQQYVKMSINEDTL